MNQEQHKKYLHIKRLDLLLTESQREKGSKKKDLENREFSQKGCKNRLIWRTRSRVYFHRIKSSKRTCLQKVSL